MDGHPARTRLPKLRFLVGTFTAYAYDFLSRIYIQVSRAEKYSCKMSHLIELQFGLLKTYVGMYIYFKLQHEFSYKKIALHNFTNVRLS